jgi:hypothetical protein
MLILKKKLALEDQRYHGDFNDSVQNGLQDGARGKHQTDPFILAYPHEVELRHGEAHSKIVDGMAQKCNAKLATGSHILGNLFIFIYSHFWQNQCQCQ